MNDRLHEGRRGGKPYAPGLPLTAAPRAQGWHSPFVCVKRRHPHTPSLWPNPHVPSRTRFYCFGTAMLRVPPMTGLTLRVPPSTSVFWPPHEPLSFSIHPQAGL